MNIPNDKQSLSALFRKLGAPSPEMWAKSQLQEGINQLGRFVFIRQAWKKIIHNNQSWIPAMREDRYTPLEVQNALRRVFSQGVDEQDLTTIVREMQKNLLFDLCYLLDDPGSLEPEIQDLEWGLFQIDKDGNPTEPISGLHESVMDLDPGD